MVCVYEVLELIRNIESRDILESSRREAVEQYSYMLSFIKEGDAVKDILCLDNILKMCYPDRVRTLINYKNYLRTTHMHFTYEGVWMPIWEYEEMICED